MSRKLVCILSLFFLCVSNGHAQVEIREIMYDAEGADVKHEWIRVENISSQSVEIADWIFFEADTSHKLNLLSGSSSIAPGDSAIIADDASVFLDTFPDYNGTIFDSSFSLKNSSETISVLNNEKIIVDEVTYFSDWGANGNGLSLHKDGGNWFERIPLSGEHDDKKVFDPASIEETIIEEEPAVQEQEVEEELPDLFLKEVVLGEEGYIEIENRSNFSASLDNWLLKSDLGLHLFPSGMEISSNANLKIRISLFAASIAEGEISFLSPRGSEINSIRAKETVIDKEQENSDYEPTAEVVSEPISDNNVEVIEIEPIIEPFIEDQEIETVEVVLDSIDPTDQVVDDIDNREAEVAVEKNNVAQVGSSVEEDNTNVWILALAGIISLALIGTFFIKRDQSDEYTIIE